MPRRLHRKKIGTPNVVHVGWHRPHARAAWQAVSRGRDWRAALLQLLDVLGPADDDQGERLILAAGVHPSEVLARIGRPSGRGHRGRLDPDD